MHKLGSLVEEHDTLAQIHLQVRESSKTHNSASHLEGREVLVLNVLGNILHRKIREIVALIGKRGSHSFGNETDLLGILGHNLDDLQCVWMTKPLNYNITKERT